MGYVGKLEQKLLAQNLRRQGLSYGEILTHVTVSKDTLSRWCRDIVLSDELTARLLGNKLHGQRKGSLVAANNKREFRLQRTQKIFNESKISLGDVSNRDFFIAGISLYCGEGDKTDGKGGFTNANPQLIIFMMKWFREVCMVPESRFRGAIWIHEGLDQGRAKEYWSDLTGIPPDQFHKTYIAVNKLDSKKIRKNIHPYGVFAIRFSCSDIQRQIMGWISVLFGDRI